MLRLLGCRFASRSVVIETKISSKLSETFKPEVLVIKNESGKHGFRHGPESHFNVLIVSSDFEGAKLVARQRKINSILKDEIKQIHSLSCSIKTPNEYDSNNGQHHTPPCGGKS